MTTAIFHKGKQTCSQCADDCNHCQTEHAAHPANRPHLAAHWLPCPTHPDPEFLQHQQTMYQKPVYDQGHGFHLDTFANALQELDDHGLSRRTPASQPTPSNPTTESSSPASGPTTSGTPAAIVGPHQLQHALTNAGIIAPGLYQPEPSQMEKYIADFVDENTHPQLDTADWEAAV